MEKFVRVGGVGLIGNVDVKDVLSWRAGTCGKQLIVRLFPAFGF